jgi:uncharacterized protein (TIGR03067 family)
MLLQTLVTFLLACPFSLPTVSDDKVSASLDGYWLPTRAEFGGKPFPDEIRKTMTLAIKDGAYTVTVGKVTDKGTLKLNPAATPKTMEITGTDGPNKGKTILAIYDGNADTLRICYDLSGKSYPTEFTTKTGTQLFLVTYKREK